MEMFKRKNQKTKISPLWKQSLIYRIGRDALVDWIGIFAMTVMVGMLAVGVGIFAYHKVESVQREVVVTPSMVKPKIDVASLDDVISEFDKRSVERTALLKGYGGVSDPSL